MSRVALSIFVAIAICQVVSAAKAAAAERATVADWSRIASPEGSMAIKLPCSPESLKWKNVHSNTDLTCISGGISYSISILDGGEYFDTFRSKAIDHYGSTHIETFELNGRRAVRTVGLTNEFDQVVEVRRDKIVLIEVVDNPMGKMPESGLPRLMSNARKFAESLEIMGQ